MKPTFGCCRWTRKGNLIAGSDGSGLVYQIKPSGEGFVLYSAPKKEITALAIDKAGNIYAAGVGEKRAGPTPSLFPAPITPCTHAPRAGAAQPGMVVLNREPSPPRWSAASRCPDGAPAAARKSTGSRPTARPGASGLRERTWCTPWLSIPGTPAGRDRKPWPYFRHHRRRSFRRSVKASATQVTAFAEGSSGRACMLRPAISAKFFCWADRAESEGSYESDVFDAKVFSRWGRAELRGAGKVELFARSGNVDNPDRNWSPWTAGRSAERPGYSMSLRPVRPVESRAARRVYRSQRRQRAAQLPAQKPPVPPAP